MSFNFPRSLQRHARVIAALLAAVALVAGTLSAQLGSFDPQHEGQLWGVHHEIPAPDGSFVTSSVFVGDRLFVASQDEAGVGGQVLAYNTSDWSAINMAAADVNNIGGGPALGLVVNEMTRATVNGEDAILVSDMAAPRVLAFDTDGAHLFTLRLDNPDAGEANVNPLINGIAMGPGASFTFNGTNQLALTGAFAAGWTNEGRFRGAALAFKDIAAFSFAGGEFSATPKVLDGTEGVGVAPASAETYGVVFDEDGNLYTLDTTTERINVYNSNSVPAFEHRFRFGTPATDNSVQEFAQPMGLAFWPDSDGGKLLVGDSINNRVAVYRPNIAGNTLTLLTSINRFGDAVDPQPFSISIDTADARLALADGTSGGLWILQTAPLVAYNLEVLDNGGSPIDTVCVSAPYQVRFSVTVPAGHGTAMSVVPSLSIGGTPVTPVDDFDPVDLAAGQVATYTFPLTMAANATTDLAIVASAASNPVTDVLDAIGSVAPSACPADNDAPVITTSQLPLAQVSGWTPIYGAQVAELTLNVTDDEALQRLEYRISGANNTGTTIPPVIFSGNTSSESVTIQLPEPGETVVEYRARDNYNVWSAWQSTTVRIVSVIDRQSNEGDQNTFVVGESVASADLRFSATNLPPGVTLDENTGQFSGLLLFDAAGVYNIRLTETLGANTSFVDFTWTVLNVNRHPTIEPLDPDALPEIVEGEPMTPIQVVGGDPDGDRVFWTAYGRSLPFDPLCDSPLCGRGLELPSTVSIDPESGEIRGTFPLNSQPGYVITVGLSECGGGTPQEDPIVCAGAEPRVGLATLYEITVVVTNKNQPPAIVDPGDKFNNEGDAVSLQIVASDPDVTFGDDVDFEVENLPPGLLMDGETGLISGNVSYTAGPRVYEVVVRARDGEAAEPLPFETFYWTITEAPPTINGLPDRIDYEGDAISISVTGGDPGGEPVTFSAIGLPQGVSIDPQTGAITGTLTFTSARPASPVTIIVTRGTLTSSTSFMWTVLERNSAPTIVAADRTNNEGDTIAPVMVATATDPEGDALTWSATGLPPSLTMLSNGLVSGVISPTGEGDYDVTVTVTDGQAAPISATFVWHVLGSNRPPTITSVDQFSNEGDTVGYGLNGLDPDGDTLTYSMTGTLPATHSIDPVTGVISGTFSYDSADVYTITVSVSDGQYTASTTFNWTVRDINRWPVIEVVDQFNLEGDSPSYRVQGSDPDGDPLTWSALRIPRGLTLSADGVFSGTFDYDSAGVYPNIYVAVCDGLLCADATFVWTVGETNRPPVVTAIPDRTDYENDPVGFQVLASDPDGDAVTYSATGLPDGATINPATGQISGTLSYTSAGVYTVTISVTDTLGEITTVTFTWTVINVNRPPVVTHPDRNNAENDTVPGYTSTASDPDGDVLTFSATGLPDGISINTSTGTLSGYLGYNTAGTYTPTITVSDGTLTASHTFNWVVTETNAPPVLTNPGPQTDYENDTISRQFTATDEDSTGLTFSATGLPPGLTMSPTGLVTGYLTYDTAAVYTVEMSVTDGTTTRTVIFTWTVIDVNRPPTVFHADRTNAENDTVTYPTTASDPDGDSLVYTAADLPSGILINSATGQLTGTLGYNSAGTYHPTITVNDGEATASHTFTWLVTNTNRPPDAVNDAATVSQGMSVTVTVLNLDSDPDGDALTVTSITQPPSGQGSATLNDDGTVTYTAPSTFVGVTTFTYTISDGNGGTDTATVTITVQTINCSTTGYTTYSQGGWGNNGAPGQLMQANFARVYPSGYVVIGGARTLTFIGAPAVTAFLPQGGTPAMLTSGPANVNNPTSSSAGNFAAQVLALRLAVDYSNAGVLKAGLGNLVMVSGPFAGQSVNSILATANAVLGGTASALPSGMTVSALNSIIESLNLNFHEGNTNAGLLACPTGPVVPPPPPPANRIPDAVNDVTSVNQGQSVVVNVLSGDSDPDGDPLIVTAVSTPSNGTAVLNANGTVTYTPAPTFSGTATFTYTISDGRGGFDTATVTVTVVGNQAPVCTAARGGEIWPPNHKRFYVAPVTGVTDPEGNPVTITVTGVWQDEALDSTGDGKFAPDARIQNGQAWIRAERNGHGNKMAGNGRVYEIVYTASDNRGGSCSGSVFWTVPHDRGQRPEAIDDGTRVDSLGVIPGVRDKSQIHQNSPQPQ